MAAEACVREPRQRRKRLVLRTDADPDLRTSAARSHDA
eukprot:CAMPEP_0206146774 /NCGR_PEP_ID=MMETSP1473-20131121/31388_1 /ASSEMBLY_ACC=CAM_ASM_001109 /TAXON_ID=1461547 /ORGANISM="Stichococcus sp, Strain RCC1054" /LENGTH=37 /DNA_ID= /DNA_START= /DNA_END= /DNA_ORIENTATION=